LIDKLLYPLVIATSLGSGVMAGLFFTFSVVIMTALARLPTAHGMAAMQSINAAILNPVFGLVFGGTAISSLALAVVSLFRWSMAGSPWILAGCLLYLVGGLLVTIVFNVPRNNALAALEPTIAPASAWTGYVSSWTAWNHVRTTLCLAATLCLVLSLRDWS